MSDQPLTLHLAMVKVLAERGGGPMTRDELAREINERSLYRGGRVPSDQLRLRARRENYADLFDCSDSRCRRISLTAAGRELARRL